MSFVLDASIAARWFLPDEANAQSEAILDRIADGEAAIAPDIFRLEIQNLMLAAERVGRIMPDDVDGALEALRDLPIRLEPSANRFLAGSEIALARRYDLTAYDAAYLACAERLGLELVTADGQLERASRHFGLPVTFVP